LRAVVDKPIQLLREESANNSKLLPVIEQFLAGKWAALVSTSTVLTFNYQPQLGRDKARFLLVDDSANRLTRVFGACYLRSVPTAPPKSSANSPIGHSYTSSEGDE
jgi:hypothetical protein